VASVIGEQHSPHTDKQTFYQQELKELYGRLHWIIGNNEIIVDLWHPYKATVSC